VKEVSGSWDADVVAVLNVDVVDDFPAGAIGPGAVDQDNIANATIVVPGVAGRESATGQEE
jgi:hypothetical protein